MTLHHLDPDATGEEEEPGRGMRLSLRQGPPDHFLRMPHVVCRQLMADLSGAEFKVLCYLVERIYSHRSSRQSQSDTISYRQLQHGVTTRAGRRITSGTGLSRDSIGRALRGLEARGLMLRVHRLHDSGAAAITELQIMLPEDSDEDESIGG